MRRYNNLYANPKLLKAHRNFLFSNPYTIYDIANVCNPEKNTNPVLFKFGKSIDGRKTSTMHISGPGMLSSVLCDEELSNGSMQEIFSFPRQYYKLPKIGNVIHQEFSWFDSKSTQDMDTMNTLFRNYILVYFDRLIDNMISNSGKEKEKMALTKLKNSLNAFPPDISFVEIVKFCLNDLEKTDKKYLKKIKHPEFNKNIISILEKCSFMFEKISDQFKDAYSGMDIAEMLQTKLNVKPITNGFGRECSIDNFVKNVLYAKQINYDKLSQYILPDAKNDLKI